jgi:hypothetical protein
VLPYYIVAVSGKQPNLRSELRKFAQSLVGNTATDEVRRRASVPSTLIISGDISAVSVEMQIMAAQALANKRFEQKILVSSNTLSKAMSVSVLYYWCTGIGRHNY